MTDAANPVPVEVQGLIERLRETRPRYDQNTGKHMYDVFNNRDGEEAATALAQQAATIAALTADNDPSWRDMCGLLEAKVAALTAEREDTGDMLTIAWMDGAHGSAKAARDRIERLEAALRRIADKQAGCEQFNEDQCYVIAREALGEE